MGQKAFIGMKQFVKKSNVTISWKELYKTAKKWFKDKDYYVWEIEINEIDKGNGKTLYHIFWKNDRALSHYAKIRFEFGMDYLAEDVTIEKNGKEITTQKGNVSISFNPYLMKDREDEWSVQEKSGLRRFLREVYDTFFDKSNLKEMESDMKKDLEEIKYYFKHYLNQKRLD